MKFDRKRGPGLKADAWRRLAVPFAEQGRTFMPHEVANYAGSNRKLARALLFALAADELAEMHLLIFHDCNKDTFVDHWPLVEGTPTLPWECPECGFEVESEDELRYDLMCIPNGPIEF